MKVIYIDSLFILNLTVNYLLTLATARICALKTRRLRFLLAALFGALFAVLSVLPNVPEFVNSLPVRLAAGVLLALIAFGSERGFGKHVIVMFGLAACFAGASMVVGKISLKTLLLAVGVSYALLTAALRFAAAKHKTDGGVKTLTLTLNGKTVYLTVLSDTGNSLRDPISGAPLPVVNLTDVQGLFTAETCKILASPFSAPEKLSLLGTKLGTGFNLVPYRAVGVDSNLLLTFRADIVLLNAEPAPTVWLALSPTLISGYNGIY
jgi:stage II sporulation protein GA (sporulation sigma-E factor processing peptidase)